MSITSKFVGFKLFAVGAENPRRKGSVGYKSHEIIRKNPGITYDEYVAKGGVPASLRYDYEHDYVEARSRAPKAKAKGKAKAKAQANNDAAKAAAK